MFEARVSTELVALRERAGLSPSEVARAAGITLERYLLLESGRGWVGVGAWSAVLDAVHASADQRARLTLPGTLEGESLWRAVLEGMALPSAILDHAWNVVEANEPFREQFPAAVGTNILAYFLVDPAVQADLVNAEEVGSAFASALRHALLADPDHATLREVRTNVPDAVWDSALPGDGHPDGQALVLRTSSGAHLTWHCLVAQPTDRPDLLHLTMAPGPAGSAPSRGRPHSDGEG
ncbi:helix-turn-helix domain-containing protein [Streptomyces noursei]|uniref:MmyB family transcriptional regulator n=1 Tax=Streptomyces noursei TaxID=1971 RepID=UPI0037FF518A